MIEYREKQKKNIVVLSVAIVLMIIAMLLRPILDAFGITTSKADDFMNGVYLGFPIGIIGVAILKIIESIRILKSDKFLKIYVNYSDERNQEIFKRQGGYFAVILIYLLIIAVLITQHFSLVIAKTLIFTDVGVITLVLILNVYYNRKI